VRAGPEPGAGRGAGQEAEVARLLAGEPGPCVVGGRLGRGADKSAVWSVGQARSAGALWRSSRCGELQELVSACALACESWIACSASRGARSRSAPVA
jgi:hypothetical protein